MAYAVTLICICLFLIYKVEVQRFILRQQTGWSKHEGWGKREGYIYFFRGRKENIWQVKIGRSKDIEARLRSHRTANPYGIVILASFHTRDDVRAETYLHHKFAQSRISPRNEWFWITFDLLLAMWLLDDHSLTRRITACLQ